MSNMEVAEDFKSSLEYLTTNDKYAINNYTVIARENTESASEICDALIEHIGKARPDHKLPTLYVLDSIAKNIGTPYTLFLGHRLYSTFMDAYSSVDRSTRKKLDEMLKTWRSPVPGSIDTRPVFPPEITRKIENALIQIRTRMLQVEQQQQRQQQELLQRRAPSATPTTQWRSTPTPPQNIARYPPPPPAPQGYPQINGHSMATVPSHPQMPQYPLPQTPTQYQIRPPPPQYPVQAPLPDLDSLHRDIEELIARTKDDFVRDISNTELQTRLKALVDLQALLRHQQLGPDALRAVRNQVRDLQMSQRPQVQVPAPMPFQNAMQNSIPSAAVTGPPPISYSTPAQTQYALPPQVVPFQPTPEPKPSQPSSTPDLASLLASVQRNMNSQPSSQPASLPTIPTPQPGGLASISAENPLFAQLRAVGLLKGTTNGDVSSKSTPPIPGAQALPTVKQPVNLSDLLRQVAAKPSQPSNPDRVELTSAALKTPRPELISKLYEARPNQCLTCGKRFLATEEGRSKKAKHLDWHFHTNQRLAESSQRGLSRSWYMDELEWIKFRESGDEVGNSSPSGEKDGLASLEDGAARKGDPKMQYIPVPSDNALASLPCPICQEKFVVSRNEEIQDFVWMDAVKIGGRVYHASCYADLKKDGGNTPRISTPDSILGKRKAEEASHPVNPSPAKALKEGSG